MSDIFTRWRTQRASRDYHCQSDCGGSIRKGELYRYGIDVERLYVRAHVYGKRECRRSIIVMRCCTQCTTADGKNRRMVEPTYAKGEPTCPTPPSL